MVDASRVYEVPEFSERLGFPVYVETLDNAFSVAVVTGCDTVHEWRQEPGKEARVVRRWWGCKGGRERARPADVRQGAFGA